MVLGLTDHHFGKLCWSPETGSDYDLKIAERYFDTAVTKCLERTSTCDLTEILIPAGNDFFHFDTRQSTTEAGTHVDSDGRWAKVYQIGTESMIRAVEACRQVAPVKVIWVPGNHDHMTSYWMCQVLKATFGEQAGVTFDLHNKSPRKYHQFGKCLLGFTHGYTEKLARLPGIMTVEQSAAWSKSTACREWLTGHRHQSRSQHWTGTYEEDGVTVRILPSLAGTDAWHHAQGYCMARHAVQSFVYDLEYGLSGIHQVSVEELK